MGMLVRGAGEGFNLVVPVRRIKRWAEKHDIMWALDASLEAPSLDKIKKLPVESVAKKKSKDDEGEENEDEESFDPDSGELPFLIRVTKK
jgi:hypothetical protein